jgi:hypothetical protein
MRPKKIFALACSFVGSITIIVVSLSASAETFHPRLTQVTWTTDIAPIVQRRCVGCHVDGGFGPMSLARYEDARNWSRAMSERAMDGTMPPWPAAVGIGDFVNDRSLTPIEIELLNAWAEGGAAEGTPSPAPVASPSTPSPMRAPDLVAELPLAADVSTPVARYELAVPLDRDRWLTAWEFHPVDHARVERAVLSVANTGRVASWLPPGTLSAFPEGVAYRLPAGATLIVEVYYRKASTRPAPGGRVALYFGPAPKHQLRHRSLSCGRTTLEEAIDVLAVEPATNESGAMVEAVARRPDRSVEPLVLVRRFVTWHVPTYRFRSAVRLPRGSRIDVQSSAAACSVGLDYVPVG